MVFYLVAMFLFAMVLAKVLGDRRVRQRLKELRSRELINLENFNGGEMAQVLLDESADQIMLDDWDRRFKNLYGQDPATLLAEPKKKQAPPRSPSPIFLSKHRFC